MQAVFFARWCNRQETLDKLNPEILKNPDELFKFLKKINPWCNETAYPVEPILWSNMKYSRLDAATKIFHLAKKKLAGIIISSNGSVVDAVDGINNIFKMKNNFPIFMAVMDIAWFRPDIIKPYSNVPVGIGAVAYIDRLKSFLGKETDEEIFQHMVNVQKNIGQKKKDNFSQSISNTYAVNAANITAMSMERNNLRGKTFFCLKIKFIYLKNNRVAKRLMTPTNKAIASP